MAKLLLINSVIREFAPPNNVPLGLCYIASYLEKHGHEVDICDLNGLRGQCGGVEYREYWLKEYQKPYDIIGLSGLIVTYQEQRRYLDYILENRQQFGYPRIISGGGMATSAPEFTLRNMPELDVVVIGEGEETALELANRMDEEDAFVGTPGTARMGSDGNIQFAPPRELIDDLSKLPFPAWEKVPVEEVYIHKPIWGGEAGNSSQIQYEAKRSMNMIVARGCPFKCRFCFHEVMGKKYRIRPVMDVIIEMMLLQKLYNVDFCGFVDDNTTANRKWVMEFCRLLQALDLGIHWGCHARVDAVEPEMLQEMKKAGCEWIGFGIESGSQRILDRMDKRITPEMAAQAIRWTRKAGMVANTTYIAGYHSETVDDLRMTAKFMRDNKAVNSMFFCQPYPETQLYKDTKHIILDGYRTEDDYIKALGDGTELRVNISDMFLESLLQGREKAMRGEAF